MRRIVLLLIGLLAFQTSAVGGSAGGFTAGYILSGGDLEFALESGWNGLKSGSITGFGVGTVSGYGYARQQGINPWTGKVEGSGRVFWSGKSTVAGKAAENFARANGMKTLEMTWQGKAMTRLTNATSYKLTEPLWNRASASFARGAMGPVNVFHNTSSGVRLNSVWRTVEYPILKGNNRIIYHNVFK